MRFRPLAAVVLVALTAFASAQERIRDVIYMKKGGSAFTFDVFKPAKPNGMAVIWMVSGGWVSDHNNINADLAKPFNDRGMTVFQVVHGAQPKFTVMEVVEQIHRSIRYIRTNAAVWGVNPNKLGISGGSAGGHLSLMMATQGGPGNPAAPDTVDRASSAVQSVAIFYPPTDMLNYGKEGQKAFDLPMLRGFWPAFGVTDATPKARAEELARAMSPIYTASAKTPPTLIFHGDKDLLVPIQQSEIFIAKLKGLGVKAELVTIPGAGHGWADMVPQVMRMVEWFEQTLK